MKKIILAALFAVVFSPVFSQKEEARFIEVSGLAFRAVPADAYFFKITVAGAEVCNIPKKGRNWEKEIKNCKEENDRLVATREAVLDAILGSMAAKIVVLPEVDDENRHSFDRKTRLKCLSFTDFEQLHDQLEGAEPGAFKLEMQWASSSNQQKIIEELTIEALKNTCAKAEKMAAVFDAKIGAIIQIHERQQGEQATAIDQYVGILQSELLRSGFNSTGSENPVSPDTEGNLLFKKEVFVRFRLE